MYIHYNEIKDGKLPFLAKPATFQVLGSHLCGVAAVLGSTENISMIARFSNEQPSSLPIVIQLGKSSPLGTTVFHAWPSPPSPDGKEYSL